MGVSGEQVWSILGKEKISKEWKKNRKVWKKLDIPEGVNSVKDGHEHHM